MTTNRDNRVTWLFAKFAATFGQKWLKPLDDDLAYDMAFEVWGKAITALTPEQLERGVEAMRASPDEWPPSVPGFLRMALGLPEEDTAARHAALLADDELSKEIRQRAGGYDVRRAERRDAERMCRTVYRELIRTCNERLLDGIAVEPRAFIEECREARRKRALQEHARDALPGAQTVCASLPEHLQRTGA